MFLIFLAYARDHQPCIIFMDEIDAIGKKLNNFKNYFCWPSCTYFCLFSVFVNTQKTAGLKNWRIYSQMT